MGDHYTETQYITRGNEVKLKFEGPLPARVTDKTNWTCLRCGKKHFKTYRALCLRPNGCRCGSATTHNPSKYQEAAAKLGIEFIPTSGLLPPNTKTKTQWRGPSGEIVSATYHEIAYKMSKRTEYLLGLTPAPADRPVKLRKGRRPSELHGLPPQPRGRSAANGQTKDPNDELVAQAFRMDHPGPSPRYA
jgi:hypothetical protein